MLFWLIYISCFDVSVKSHFSDFRIYVVPFWMDTHPYTRVVCISKKAERCKIKFFLCISSSCCIILPVDSSVEVYKVFFFIQIWSQWFKVLFRVTSDWNSTFLWGTGDLCVYIKFLFLCVSTMKKGTTIYRLCRHIIYINNIVGLCSTYVRGGCTYESEHFELWGVIRIILNIIRVSTSVL